MPCMFRLLVRTFSLCVAGKGDASFTLTDKFGVKHDIMLKNALYVPSFSQNIFSVCSW